MCLWDAQAHRHTDSLLLACLCVFWFLCLLSVSVCLIDTVCLSVCLSVCLAGCFAVSASLFLRCFWPKLSLRFEIVFHTGWYGWSFFWALRRRIREVTVPCTFTLYSVAISIDQYIPSWISSPTLAAPSASLWASPSSPSGMCWRMFSYLEDPL